MIETSTPKNLSDLARSLESSETDTGYNIETAKVAWLDQAKIESSFRAEKPTCEWVLENCAYISESQLENQCCNSPIQVGAKTKTFLRPPRYGRAAVVEVNSGASAQTSLIDLKGCGVVAPNVPVSAAYKTGLLSLSEAFCDLTMQKVLETIFVDAGVDVRGVEIYSIISLGFDAFDPFNRETVPAAIMVRAPHFREDQGNEIPKKNDAKFEALLAVEKILRQYGVTSGGYPSLIEIDEKDGQLRLSFGRRHLRSIPQEVIRKLVDLHDLEVPTRLQMSNIQSTRGCSLDPLSLRLFDFGHYRFEHEFNDHFFIPVEDAPFNLHHLIRRNSAEWPVSKDLRRVNYDTVKLKKIQGELANWCGLPDEAEIYRFREFGLELARGFAVSGATPADIDHQISSYIKKILPWS